jgi:outer membrane protein assembly factor BamA
VKACCRIRLLHGCLAAGAIALFAAGPATAQIGRTEVREVGFVGNQAFPTDSLARAIVTRETECRSVVLTPFCWADAEFAIQRSYLPRRELPRDQLRLRLWYRARGYREAAVDTATVVHEDGTAAVTFTIDEGEPVRVGAIQFFGAEDLDDPELLSDLPLEVGVPLSTIALDATRDTLVNRLADNGFARADVLRSFFIPAEDPYNAGVTFDIAPGPRARYGHVSVDGNENLSESTVLRTLQFRAGDVYRVSRLQQAQARLFGLGIIRSASVVPDFETGPDSVIPVAVRLQEGDLHRVRTGGGWSTAECFDVDARWVNRNYFGGGRRLQVRGRVSNILANGFHEMLCPQSGSEEFGQLNGILQADFTQPWLFSTRNSFMASVYVERQSLPDVFIQRAAGMAFAITRFIGPRTPFTASYRPELSQLIAAEILFCTSFLVCSPEDIESLLGANWLAPVGLNFTRTTTNNVLNPSRGYSMVLDLEHAARWTGSNFPYNRALAEGSAYERITDRNVLAGRLRTGWVDAGRFEQALGRDPESDIVHPQKRFYGGGANSVRGFAQGRLGPGVLTPRDVRLLLDPQTTGGAGCAPESIVDLTCDASPLGDGGFIQRPTGGTRVLEGNLELRFPLASGFEAATFADFGQVWGPDEAVSLGDLEVTPGVGIRYLSPIGPLRFDLAYQFRGGQELSVVTNQLRPFDPLVDEAPLMVDGQEVPWVATETLAVLTPTVLFDDSPALSLRRLQLHISIGQAF